MRASNKKFHAKIFFISLSLAFSYSLTHTRTHAHTLVQPHTRTHTLSLYPPDLFFLCVWRSRPQTTWAASEVQKLLGKTITSGHNFLGLLLSVHSLFPLKVNHTRVNFHLWVTLSISSTEARIMSRCETNGRIRLCTIFTVCHQVCVGVCVCVWVGVGVRVNLCLSSVISFATYSMLIKSTDSYLVMPLWLQCYDAL